MPMPDMGVNYLTLANAQRPTMMPNAPIGAGGMAGQMYFNDKAKQDASLEQATGLAAMDAQMRASAADEYSRGAPGRQADIDVSNAMSGGKRDNLPSALDKQRIDSETGAQSARATQLEVLRKTVEPYADQWDTATPPQKEIIRQQMIDDGVKLGKKDVSELSTVQMDQVMKVTRQGAVNSVSHEQKMDLEETKQDAATQRNAASIESRLKIADDANKIRAKIAGDKNLKNIPDPNKYIFYKLLEQGHTQQEASAWYQSAVQAVETAKAGARPQQMDINPDNLDNPLSTRQPPRPQPVVPPAGPVGQPAPQPQQGGGKVKPRGEALQILEAMKGTPQEAQARAYFKQTYGEDAP